MKHILTPALLLASLSASILAQTNELPPSIPGTGGPPAAPGTAPDSINGLPNLPGTLRPGAPAALPGAGAPAVPGSSGAPAVPGIPSPGGPGLVPGGPGGRPAAGAAPGTVPSPGGDEETPAQKLARETEQEVVKAHLQQVRTEIQQWEQAPSGTVQEQETRAAQIAALNKFAASLDDKLAKLNRPMAKHGNRISGDTGKAGLPQGHRPIQAVGAPDASEDTFEGKLLAWHAQPSGTGKKEWLGLIYDRPVEVAEIRIHNLNTTGTLARVTGCVRGGSGPGETVLWEGREQEEKTPCVQVITLAAGHFANGIRLEFDPARSKKWQQIDAVELVGRDGSRQWAKFSEASSYYPVTSQPPATGKNKPEGGASN